MQGIQPQVKEYAAAKTEKGRLDQQQIKFERKTDLEKQYASMNPKIKRQASANKKAKDALAKLHGLEQELKKTEDEACQSGGTQGGDRKVDQCNLCQDKRETESEIGDCCRVFQDKRVRRRRQLPDVQTALRRSLCPCLKILLRRDIRTGQRD